MSWQEVLKENSFSIWVKGGRKFSEYTKIEEASNRKTALEMVEEIAAKGNPRPWTVEGDEYGGRLVVYHGIAEMLNAPTYDYQIIPDEEEPDDKYNPIQEHEIGRSERALDRMKGKKFETFNPELREKEQ